MIYAYAKLTVSNPEALSDYRDKAGSALARHGGKVVQGSGNVIPIDGAPDVPDVAAILSFPDKNSALQWIKDPDLADIHALRRSSGGSEILLLT